jgi:uncharacterized protein YbjT (DUF2867 family)
MRTALIAGATGLVGDLLLRQLLDSPEYGRVVALGRRPPALGHPKLVAVTVEFTALDTLTGSLRCADAFCCLGTTIKQAGSRENFRAVDLTAVLAFAWAAQRNGSERFYLVSALGANAQSRVFYNRIKGKTEEGLQVLGFKTLGLFRPSLLLGPRRKKRAGERVAAAIMGRIEPVLIGPLRQYRAIEAAVVARAMLRCACDPTVRGVQVFPSDKIQAMGRPGR